MTQSRFLPLSSTTNSTGYGFLSITDITDSIAIDFVNAKVISTSTTSLTIASGLQSLIIGTSLPLYVGQSATISSDTNQMVGLIVSYNPTTGALIINVTTITGSGTSSTWNFMASNDARLQNWLDLVDGEVLALAQEKEVPLQSISIPLHKKILEFCKAYFNVICFEDSFGRNDIVQTDRETIKLKLEYWTNKKNQLRSQCSKEMFLYTNLGLIASQVSSGTISIARA